MMVSSAPRRGKWRKPLALALLFGFLALNGVAWMQAWAMTHYAPAGQRTPAIEALSLPEKAGVVLTGVRVPKPQNAHTPLDVRLAYETHNVGVGQEESLEAWYVPHPQAQGTVLMFPGYAVSKGSLLHPAATLHDLGYNVLLVDFRGAGGSSGQETTLGVREAEDVAAAVDYARQQWPGQPIVLHGVSMGAAAVLRAVAVENIQANALILESPFDTLLNTVRNRFHAMGLPAFPSAELLVFWGSVQHGFNGFAHNPVEYAQSVELPTLLMHGERDPRVTAEQARAIFDSLRGRKEFVSFSEARHESLFAVAPELWKEQVARFLIEAGARY